jgi:hypothetical protein
MSVRAYRAAMLSGVAFALLLFFGATQMYSSTPDTSDNSAAVVTKQWAAWITDSGHRHSVLIGAFLTMLAAVALVWFASALRTRVAPGSSPLMGFAVLAASGLAASMLGPLSITGGHAFGGDPLTTNGDVIWFTFGLTFPALLVMFGLAVAAFIATVCVTGRGVLPMWLIIFGWIAVLGAVAAIEFLPMVLVLLWFLAAGIYGAVRPAGATTDPVT